MDRGETGGKDIFCSYDDAMPCLGSMLRMPYADLIGFSYVFCILSHTARAGSTITCRSEGQLLPSAKNEGPPVTKNVTVYIN